MNFNKHTILAFCTSLCASLFVLHAAAEGATEIIDVKGQLLPGALMEFSEQTDLQLAYVATLANGKASPGTQGKTRPGAALSDILRGTELEYQFVNDETVAIGARRTIAETGKNTLPAGGRLALEPILMAQAQQPSQQDESSQDELDEDSDSDASSDDAEVSDAAMEEIIVTGSRLQRTPSQIAANLVTMDEDALRATGEISLDKALRTLPQNQLGRVQPRPMQGSGVNISMAPPI